jgi:serine protease Do
VDAKVKVIIIRDGKKKEFDVQLEPQPRDFEARFRGHKRGEGEEEESEPEESEYDNVLNGISVQELTSTLAEKLDLPKDIEGVLVADVDPDSVAAGKGLRKGDVIEEIKRAPVKSVDDFHKLAAKVKKDETVLLAINRQGMSLFLALTPSKDDDEKKSKTD